MLEVKASLHMLRHHHHHCLQVALVHGTDPTFERLLARCPAVHYLQVHVAQRRRLDPTSDPPRARAPGIARAELALQIALSAVLRVLPHAVLQPPEHERWRSAELHEECCVAQQEGMLHSVLR